MDMTARLAEEFALKPSQVEQTVKLIDEGNTIPFIARYRKEATGGLSDVTLREIDERLAYMRSLEERKEEVIRLIEEQGKLTEALEEEIRQAQVLQRVEDLYKPYKKKKATRASKARERGLEPLALVFLAQEKEEGSPEAEAGAFIDPEKEVNTAEEAVKGACDIIAEMISDNADITAAVRDKTAQKGIVAAEGTDPGEKTVYEMYYDYREEVSKIPNHRILAVNRGEKEKKLKVKIETDTEAMERLIESMVITNEASVFTGVLKDTVSDAYRRLMAPSAEREIRNLLTERAEEEAVKVFAKNTEKLLMAPPVKGARIISIDPGYRTGCKVAVINETGKLLAYTTVYPTKPREDVEGTEKTLAKLADRFRINTIVIGNGTASRETEEVVADFIEKHGGDISYTIVNEAGASVYSASKLAAEEYPDLDVTVRGALSLGRRLQDPLAELVKIPTKSIGVGQYQHDINQSLLEKTLDNVVEDCVNRVGVDINTASPSLLSHVAGINMSTARSIVAYREENGPFKERKELKKVPKLGEKTFAQCAGFMRIGDGKEPLDSTAVHPESYKAAEAMLKKLGIEKNEIKSGGAADIEEKIWEIYGQEEKRTGKRIKDLAALAEISGEKGKGKRNMAVAEKKLSRELDIGVPTLKDIIEEIKKPGRDPRDGAPPVVFRKDVRSFEDLRVGMELEGTVRNVVDFGAFVDIGVKNDGLVHISEISERYIKHPSEAVSVGDTVKVRIISLDEERQKTGLTMKTGKSKKGR
ncbi:MAG TPA: RNA-binding transcriptional accessory protein [Candidatus Copromorpha excrementigallinarum]|uniref:RNA-binding transcriptional accessory protein n=1 Tax=Candidatus Allocopromorpha excrementigallinarum TaxID=2840742 RepID=A0A9D1L775_9FIRM|nr:RNA-binding transcriptional accessory protein [Candidatus Copromorpha excrementigallinarum]